MDVCRLIIGISLKLPTFLSSQQIANSIIYYVIPFYVSDLTLPINVSGEDELLFLYELNDTINTDGFAGLWVNEDIRRVHIFKVQTVADIVHSVTVTIVMEAF